jgi:hypothetical protein
MNGGCDRAASLRRAALNKWVDGASGVVNVQGFDCSGDAYLGYCESATSAARFDWQAVG